MLKLFMSFFFLTLFLKINEIWFFSLVFYFIWLPFFIIFNFSFLMLSKNSYFMIDLYSYMMLILSLWIVVLSVFSSFYIILTKSGSLFLFLFNFLNFLLIMCFLTSNVLFFFFLFESSLIPILYVILGWGYKIERLKSGMYMFFYTLFGSLPMLISIFFFSKSNNSLIFNFLENVSFLNLIYLVSIFAFLIKMPMYLVHSWLPKAHVEAPVSGSMVLAGILLKLGGYGIFRFSFIYMWFLKFSNFWIYLSIWGGLVSSFICLRQIDVKSLIAYSSVSHMSIVILGLLIFNNLSIMGSFLMMFSHGVCSSCLFYIFNLIYERSGTRSIFLNKGLMSIFPSLSMWWFIFCSCNMAAPPSLNLLSEMLLMNSVSLWDFNIMFVFMFLCFMAGVYNLFIFSFMCHGKVSSFFVFSYICKVREFLICFLHFFPLNFLFLKLDLFM